ncbi:MAG: sulfatase family protein, partial [Nocardioidaceae bacterium]
MASRGESRRRAATAIALAAVFALVQPIAATPPGVSTAAGTVAGLGASAGRPNIVLITTDDQRDRDLRFMPLTRRLLEDAGTSFTGISPHPLCCPARAELLTGQYAQNNGVRSNRGAYGGYAALDNTQTLGTWLQNAGYRTAYLGKYLNGYGFWDAVGPEPGWTSWHPTIRGTYNYSNFTVSHGGRAEHVSDYQTDYFTALARRQIRTWSKGAAPFFLWQSYMAPHTTRRDGRWLPPRAASRHLSLFQDLALDTRTSPAFNEADLSDKPLEMQQRPRLDRTDIRHLERWNRQRLRALRAVDEGVAATLSTLEAVGELDNTLVIFTSDNGYLLGEHRVEGKILGYEPSLRVPILVRGPGFPADTDLKATATTIDIAATIVAAAGAEPGLPLDGQDLAPVAARVRPGADSVLIQGGPRNRREDAIGWFYRGVRTARYTYMHYLG